MSFPRKRDSLSAQQDSRFCGDDSFSYARVRSVIRALHALSALLSHWRRKPLQLVALLGGLTIATALWSGVQALNAQARTAYDRAAQTLGGDAVPSLALPGGARFDQQAFVDLRRAGWPVSPVLEGRLRAGETRVRIIGIEPLTMPAEARMTGEMSGPFNGEMFEGFMAPPWRAFAAPETVEALRGEAGLPPLVANGDMAPGLLLMDIGAAQDVLEAPGQITRLLLDPDAPPPAGSPGDATDLPLERSTAEAQGDLDRLTKSFHLNLTAFGLLAFLVGLFIVYSAIALAFEQRLPILRTLRALGISARMLTGVLLAELLSLSLLGGIAGVVGGYLIAAALMPDVAASLGGLYGAEVPGTLSLEPSWWLAGIAISVFGAMGAAAYSLLKAYRMPPLAAANRYAWRAAQRGWLWAQGGLAIVLLIAAAGLMLFAEGLVAGFAGLAALLLGAALLLPPALAVILKAGQGMARGPLSQWFWADAQQQLSGLSLALMALLLALGANIGVGTMVNGFRDTFTDWLDRRLVADIYYAARNDAENAQIRAWLADRSDVITVLQGVQAEALMDGLPILVAGYTDDAVYRRSWPMIAIADGAFDRVARGEAVFASEQLAARLDLSVGDRIEVAGWTVPVAGIYPDYGNPKGQISAGIDTVRDRFPGARRSETGLLVAGGQTEKVIAAMRERFGMEDNLIDQGALKRYSRGVFEDTFAVTAALNVLTMGVAGFALFMSLLTLSEMRLPQLAPLWAAGVTRRSLAGLELLKTLAMALFTALLAIPLGLAVAWCLVAVVNVQAFGWRLPFHLFPGQWVALVGLALLTAGLAALWPILSLRTMPPVRLVRVFTDER